MAPYILLHDRARTASVATPDDFSLTIPDFPASSPSTALGGSTPAALDDFLDYADRLLAKSPSGTETSLSPSVQTTRRRSSSVDHSPTNMKEAIDVAILRSNQSSSSDQPSQSTNRFTISRAGQHVAVISMLRPAYRLGETVTGVIDFLPPQGTSSQAIPTYAVTITLETVERIDPSLALRSASSVQRATRKVHASVSETVLFAHQTSFRLEVPTSATPSFETTGVHLAWHLRVEFGTSQQQQQASVTPPSPLHTPSTTGLGISNGGEDEDAQPSPISSPHVVIHEPRNEVLREVARDDRGVVLAAREALAAETFEVAVPIKVFGVGGLVGEGVLGNGVAEALEI